MAKLPQIKRLATEDFPDLEGIEKLLQPLNEFMESIVLALNNQLTVGENLIGLEREITVRTDSGGDPLEVAAFAWTLRQRVPVHAIVTRVITRSGVAPVAATGVTWSFDGNAVKINDIFGLSPSSEYLINLIILGR